MRTSKIWLIRAQNSGKKTDNLEPKTANKGDVASFVAMYFYHVIGESTYLDYLFEIYMSLDTLPK